MTLNLIGSKNDSRAHEFKYAHELNIQTKSFHLHTLKPEQLQRVRVQFTGANAHDFFQISDEDFAITDLAA